MMNKGWVEALDHLADCILSGNGDAIVGVKGGSGTVVVRANNCNITGNNASGIFASGGAHFFVHDEVGRFLHAQAAVLH